LGALFYEEISVTGLVNKPFFSYSALRVAKEHDHDLFLTTLHGNKGYSNS